jgi:hypothetical protein
MKKIEHDTGEHEQAQREDHGRVDEDLHQQLLTWLVTSEDGCPSEGSSRRS